MPVSLVAVMLLYSLLLLLLLIMRLMWMLVLATSAVVAVADVVAALRYEEIKNPVALAIAIAAVFSHRSLRKEGRGLRARTKPCNASETYPLRRLPLAGTM